MEIGMEKKEARREEGVSEKKKRKNKNPKLFCRMEEDQPILQQQLVQEVITLQNPHIFGGFGASQPEEKDAPNLPIKLITTSVVQAMLSMDHVCRQQVRILLLFFSFRLFLCFFFRSALGLCWTTGTSKSFRNVFWAH
jgi:hypothetical protein